MASALVCFLSSMRVWHWNLWSKTRQTLGYQLERLEGGDSPESTDDVGATHCEDLSMTWSPK